MHVASAIFEGIAGTWRLISLFTLVLCGENYVKVGYYHPAVSPQIDSVGRMIWDCGVEFCL